MLHVSEKTIRRRIKAGELTASKQPLDGGGIGWRVLHANLIYTETGSAMDNEVDNVPEVETEARRKRSGHAHAQTASAPDNAMDVPDNRMDSSVARAGTEMDKGVNGSAPSIISLPDERKTRDRGDDAATDFRAKYIAELEASNIYLKLRLEEAMQSEAQTKAALREALKAMPKQLTTGTPVDAATPSSSPETPDAPQIGQTANTATPSSDAVKSAVNRTPRPLWKVMFGIR